MARRIVRDSQITDLDVLGDLNQECSRAKLSLCQQ